MSADLLDVAIADDNALIRMGLRALLECQPDMRVVGEARDGRQAIELVRGSRPDVLLLDVRMPVLDGLAALASLTPLTNVVMLTHDEQPDTVTDALKAGACGYLTHGRFRPDELCRAVRVARQGGSVLSPPAAAVLVDRLRREGSNPVPDRTRRLLSRREAEVMDLVAQGAGNQQIARTLYVTEKTTKNHLTRIYAKLGASSRAHAVACWLGSDRPAPADVEVRA